MKTNFSAFLADESGATAIEYGLLAAVIGVAIIGAMTLMSGEISAVLTRLATLFAANG